MIATYLLLVEIAKRRFYPSKPTPAGRGQPSSNATSGASNGASNGVPSASSTTPPRNHADAGRAQAPTDLHPTGDSQHTISARRSATPTDRTPPARCEDGRRHVLLLGEASPPYHPDGVMCVHRGCTDDGVVARSGRRTRGATVSNEQLEEMGPIDYVVLEWPGELPTTGEVQPLLLDLVDRGIIRILDIAFLTKDEDGSVRALDVGNLEQVAAAFAAFEGASSGLLGFDDLQEAAAALDPGTSAAVLVWENRWAAPVAAALRRSGGQLVASGRIPVQAVLAALDAVEATN
jgi:Family of unknown function (DUF6325)